MEPTLAAVIFVGAMLALVRVLLPPKVGQSCVLAAARTVDPDPCESDAFDCCDNSAQPQVVATAQVRSALWIILMPYPLVDALYSIPYIDWGVAEKSYA
jgi:hypothetical protein